MHNQTSLIHKNTWEKKYIHYVQHNNLEIRSTSGVIWVQIINLLPASVFCHPWTNPKHFVVFSFTFIVFHCWSLPIHIQSKLCRHCASQAGLCNSIYIKQYRVGKKSVGRVTVKTVWIFKMLSNIFYHIYFLESLLPAWKHCKQIKKGAFWKGWFTSFLY